MYIWNVEKDEKYEEAIQAFGLQKDFSGMISFVGAGGKTTLIYRMAEEWKNQGKKVIITTTTHMQKPKAGFVEWDDEIIGNSGERSAFEKQLQQRRILTVGKTCVDANHLGKIEGIAKKAYAFFGQMADVVLVEADGAKKYPVKIPAVHEPVIPEETDVTVMMLGYRAIGKRIENVAYRAGELAAFLGKTVVDDIELEDLQRIWFREGGIGKGRRGKGYYVLSQCPKRAILELLEAFGYEKALFLYEEE